MDTKDIILKLRTGKGMSQDELAEKVFVTRQAVSRWESGDATPSIDKLKALAKIYDVSLDWLCSDADEMEGRDKQPTKKQEATEINEDKQQSAVQNKSRQKKVGIVVAIIIFGMLLLGWLFYQKEKAARPMEDMTSKTIEPEESENTESFDFGW